MTYIVNPSAFYWISVTNALKYAALFIWIISGCVCAGCVIGAALDDAFDYLKKAIILSGVLTVVFLTAFIFLPDKETSTEMLIARMATVENAQLATEKIKEIVDYIAAAMSTGK